MLETGEMGGYDKIINREGSITFINVPSIVIIVISNLKEEYITDILTKNNNSEIIYNPEDSLGDVLNCGIHLQGINKLNESNN